MPRGMSEKWIIKMNERFEIDHSALFDAYRHSGDHESLGLGLKALGQCDYDSVKYYHSRMLAQPNFRETFVTCKNTNDVYNNMKQKQDQEQQAMATYVEQKAKDLPIVNQSQDLIDKTVSCVEDKQSSSEQVSNIMPPVVMEPVIHRENVIIKTDDLVTIELVDSEVDDSVCDPATCVVCEAIPYPLQPKISPGCVVVYGGPGSGKTKCIRDIRRRYGKRANVWDTDHMSKDTVVPPQSLIFTNRPDIFASYNTGVKIAFVPYRRHWIRQCLEKCAHTKDSWFDDMITNIRRSLVIRENCFMSDRLLFSM